MKKNEKIIAIIVSVLALIPIILFQRSLSSITRDENGMNNNISQKPDTLNSQTINQIVDNVNVKSSQNQEDNKAEKEYIDEAKSIIKDFTDSLNYLSQLLDEKPLYAYWSENEKAIGALSSVTIEQAYDKAIKLSPPARFVESHNILLQSLKKYKQAMPLFRQGMDKLDKQKINQSTTLMIEGASLLRQATDIMNQ